MNFSEALKAMKMGSKVSREAWRGTISYIYITDDERIMGRYPNGHESDTDVIDNDDILADDWWIVT